MNVPTATPRPAPTWTLRTVGALSALCGASSIALIVLSGFVAPQPIWVLFGFESVALLAAVIGVLFGLGRFQDGQGLALACVAGTLVVGAFLPWLGTRQGVVLVKDGPTISLVPWVAARLAVGTAIGLLGAWVVLRRNPRSTQYALRAATSFGVMGAMSVALIAGRGLMAAWDVVPRVSLLALCGLIAVPLFCAGVHCTIRAFECGRTGEDAPSAE